MSSLLILFAENIFPILLVASFGFILQKLLNVDPRALSQVTFYLFAPALVFELLFTAEISGEGVLQMVVLVLLLVLFICGFSMLVARLLRLPGRLATAFVLTATFMNAGNYGLSLNQFALGSTGLAWASIFFVMSALLTNSLGVYIANVGSVSPWEALKRLARIPSIYAILLAFLFRAMGLTLPLPIWRPLELLSDAAIPSMLVILGLQIGLAGIPINRGLLSLVAAIRLLVSPALALILSVLLGLEGVSRQAGVIEAATPTAVLTTILALEFDVEPDFVSGAVLFTTLLSPLTITPFLALVTG